VAEYRLPSLGADMESATLTEWLVKPGQEIKRGDLVASVETSKGIIDIEIFEAGRIDQLLVAPGTEIPVGAVLATYAPAGGEPSPAAAPPIATPAMRAVAAPSLRPTSPAMPPEQKAAAPPEARVRASPAARRRALELGIDLSAVSASGAEGAITLEDVERRAAAASTPPADTRSAIAKAMSRSKREIPHYYLATTIDMRATLAWVERWNAAHAVTERLLSGALLVKSVARALAKFPELNGFWLDGRFEPSREVNVGVAIRLRQGGLVVPGIPRANELTLTNVMQQLQGLVRRARAGRLRQSDITNATITVSSLGEGGVETLYPIIYPPQVAIVGFGSIVTRPWHAGGSIVAAPLLSATLSGDHRVSDGQSGSQFLIAVDRLLQRPEEL
jgi:pyruvate dehydrogenase E2 component (dihydrolipoamide acetyltransferase)